MSNRDKAFHNLHAGAAHTDGLLQIVRSRDLDLEKAGSPHIDALSDSDSAHLICFSRHA